MRLHRLSHELGIGWQDPFPKLKVAPEQQLILAFAAPSYSEHPSVFAQLHEQFPGAIIIGCSTAGEIHGSSLWDQSLSLAVIEFEKTQLRLAGAPITQPGESYAVGTALGETLRSPDLQAVLLLSDGVKVNGSALVRGLNAALEQQVPVTGGLAGDGVAFKQTWVLDRGATRSGWVSAVGLYGPHVRVSRGSKGGWDIFGPERIVTKSEGNVLYEIDETPALALYKRYLGEMASALPASALLFPLAVRPSALSDEILVRTVLQVDETNQSMTFAGDIPQGCRARLMRSNFDRLVEGAVEAASLTQARFQGVGPALSIAISCVGRRMLLGARTEEEIEAILEILPPQTEQVGYYSYGEISPFVQGEPCALHNQTMTITLIWEE